MARGKSSRKPSRGKPVRGRATPKRAPRIRPESEGMGRGVQEEEI